MCELFEMGVKEGCFILSRMNDYEGTNRVANGCLYVITGINDGMVHLERHQRSYYTGHYTIEKFIGHVLSENFRVHPMGYRPCDSCDAMMDQDDMTHFSDRFYCDGCFSDVAFTCDHCNEYHFHRDMRVVPGGDEYCEECYNSQYTYCPHCSEYHDNDSINNQNGQIICDECLPNFSICTHCNEYVPNESFSGDSDDSNDICSGCAESVRGKPLNRYHFQPKPIFHGSNVRKFGIELEIDKGGKSSHNARLLLQTGNGSLRSFVGPYIYCKTDSSLDDGIEIVSHPCDFDYHINEVNWQGVLDVAVDNGYSSHDAGTCGLHVHVSKASFGETEAEQDVSIAKILLFTEYHWDKILKISRRTKGQIDEYAKRYGLENDSTTLLNRAKNSQRYHAVNLQNEHTIEFRFMRGTLAYNTFIASLQFINAMCSMADTIALSKMQGFTWTEFVTTYCAEYPELMAYLKKRCIGI